MVRSFVNAVMLAAALGALAGCGQRNGGAPGPDASTVTAASVTPDANASSASADDPCGATRVEKYMNRRDEPTLRAEIAGLLPQETIRWIRPGEAVTQDYLPGRLNIIVSEDNRIDAIRCG